MAVDTYEKRLSIINFLFTGTSDTLPLADASIDQGDRQHFLDFYSGNLAVAASTLESVDEFVAIFDESRDVITFDESRDDATFDEGRELVTFGIS